MYRPVRIDIRRILPHPDPTSNTGPAIAQTNPDMSEIEDLQKELAEAKGRFRSLMDNCVDAMIIIDQDGSILDFNPAAENIFQYRAEEVMGSNVSILMPEPYQ